MLLDAPFIRPQGGWNLDPVERLDAEAPLQWAKTKAITGEFPTQPRSQLAEFRPEQNKLAGRSFDGHVYKRPGEP